MKKGPNDIANLILFEYIVSNYTTVRIKRTTNYSELINSKLRFFGYESY
jgi:hypothetical protein